MIPGFVSDRIGPFNVMSIVSALCTTVVLAFWLPLNYQPSNASILVFAVVYGFVQGGFVSLMAPCIVALGHGRVENLGKRFGIGCLSLALG